jgi:hypothetical protein
MNNADSGGAQGGKTQAPIKFRDREKIASVCSGFLLGLSLILIDSVLLSFASEKMPLLGVMLPTNVVMSGLFAASIGGGFLVGKAFLGNSALMVIVYGGAWVLSVFFAYVISLPHGLFQMLSASSSLLIAGSSLGLYRVLQGQKGIDELLVLVMTASTFLNLLYFVLVLGVVS